MLSAVNALQEIVFALAKIYFDQREVGPEKDTIVYCRIGERSSHTWLC